MTITQYVKDISYDREARDYAYYLDGELMGFARTYHEAEVTLDQLVYELLMAQPAPDEKICPTCGGEGDCPDCCPTVVGPDPERRGGNDGDCGTAASAEKV